MDVVVVRVSKIWDVRAYTRPTVIPSHMVGDEIEDHFQAGRVGPLHQGLELIHPFRLYISEIRIDIIIVRDGVGRAGVTLGEGLAGGVAEDACIPDMGHSEGFEIGERGGVDR